MRTLRGWLVAGALGALGWAGDASAQQAAKTVEEFLARDVALTSQEIAAVARGEAVSKLVPSANNREVTVFGVVRIDVPRATFVQRNTDFARSPRAATRTYVGIFGTPATTADMAVLDITKEDINELRKCRPNDCDLKLPATDMAQLQATIDWSSPETPARVSEYVRQRFAELVNDYRARGNAAMVTYDDRGSVSSGGAFEEMLSQSAYVYRYAPSFQKYISDYPKSALPGATEVIYWSVDDIPRLKRVFRITHQSIFSPPEIEGATMIASKQIYSDHYFEAGLEVLTAVDRVGPSGRPAIDLLVVRRYRFDQLPGGILNIKARVSNGLRDQARGDLLWMKQEYERGTAPRR